MGFQPVMWGQCWVFSGVLTTLGRTIGIPTRSVTNFESAHDHKPFDNYITKHWTYDKNSQGKFVWTHDSNKDADSIWNFHVWNDMWMLRPDQKDNKCGVDMNGWQAVDATWQEQSEDPNMMSQADPNHYYQCGPLSVNAIKAKCKDSSFDYMFIHGEVESHSEERVRNLKEYPGSNKYIQDATAECQNGGSCKAGYTVDKRKVGKWISTSAVGENPMLQHVITKDYKLSEDEAMLGEDLSWDGLKASGNGVSQKRVMMVSKQGWGTVHVEHGSTMRVGTDFIAKILLVQNPSGEDSGNSKLDITWSLNLQTYNGKFARNLKTMTQSIDVDASTSGKGGKAASAELEIKLKASEYESFLKQGMTMSLDASGVQQDDLIFRFSEVKSVMKLPTVNVELTSPSTEPIEKCAKESESKLISFSMTVQNPFDTLQINASRLVAEIAGMDKTPEHFNPEWKFEVDSLQAGNSRQISKHSVDVSKMSCGIHTISAVWDIDEVAEATDAAGSTTFTIGCENCSPAANSEDQSDEVRETAVAISDRVEQVAQESGQEVKQIYDTTSMTKGQVPKN